jgi:hypothetical protein
LARLAQHSRCLLKHINAPKRAGEQFHPVLELTADA